MREIRYYGSLVDDIPPIDNISTQLLICAHSNGTDASMASTKASRAIFNSLAQYRYQRSFFLRQTLTYRFGRISAAAAATGCTGTGPAHHDRRHHGRFRRRLLFRMLYHRFAIKHRLLSYALPIGIEIEKRPNGHMFGLTSST